MRLRAGDGSSAAWVGKGDPPESRPASLSLPVPNVNTHIPTWRRSGVVPPLVTLIPQLKPAMRSLAKRIMKPWHRAASDRLRQWRVRSAVRDLRRAALLPESVLPVMSRLRMAWGNTGWSADLGFLDAIVRQILETPGPFLECGAGVSTLILGVLAERTGKDVWSLEQDEEWFAFVRKELRDLGLERVHLVDAPLEVRDGAAWYAFDDQSFPRSFTTVFCDGPAIKQSEWPESVHRAWRSGVVRELRRRGIAFETILLDDAENPRCPFLLENWRESGLITHVVETPYGRHVLATDPAADQSGEKKAK